MLQMIKEVSEIEAQLVERGCLAGGYCPTLLLHVVGVLRKYHCCLLGESIKCLLLNRENVQSVNELWKGRSCVGLLHTTFIKHNPCYR